jgi:peptidoglycan/xylan/chitin deacetylase (PgdA/CDA1 family)
VPKVQWPGEARLALNIVVNYEAGSERSTIYGDSGPETYGEFAAYGTPPKRDLGIESVFEYETRVAVWRLLDLFKKHDVKVTFFATAKTLEASPEAAKRIAAEGHEICSHGYRWVEHYTLSKDEEREVIRKATRIIEDLTGQRPLGWYCREPSENTVELLVEEGGFLYDSDAYNDDLPYYVNVNGTRFLIVPYTPDANDFHFFSNRFSTSSQFYEYLKDTLDVLYQEGASNARMMSVGTHARISGRPGRINAIDRFLAYAKAFPKVWIARRIDIARWWLDRYK